MIREIHIIGGGTVSHVRPHLALCAPAYGGTARRLAEIAGELDLGGGDHAVLLHLTRMADGGERGLETNEDLAMRLAELVARPETHMVFMTAAVCDFEGGLDGEEPGTAPLERARLVSWDRWEDAPMRHTLRLSPAEKLVSRIRAERKDIFLAACKTTTGKSADEMFEAGLRLLKRAHCNLVLVNDLHTGWNMVVTPEQARYAVTEDRAEALRALVGMAKERSAGTFVRTTVMPGPAVPLADPRVPASLREVVGKLVEAGAYREFDGKTVGHYGCRLSAEEFLFSRRGRNYNESTDMVRCRVTPGGVVAVGGKPSAGAATQRRLFEDHPGYDCVAHFHCPPSPHGGREVPRRPQRGLECGSLECGENTSEGMAELEPGVKVVYLEQHGPNVLWDSRKASWGEVWRLVEKEFDLRATTRDEAEAELEKAETEAAGE